MNTENSRGIRLPPETFFWLLADLIVHRNFEEANALVDWYDQYYRVSDDDDPMCKELNAQIALVREKLHNLAVDEAVTKASGFGPSKGGKA